MLVEQAIRLLDEQQPMTVRQLFYRLVSIEAIENTRAGYQTVSRIITKAREDGRIPFEHIVDRSRPVYQPNVFANPTEYADCVVKSYRKDNWQMQSCHVEVWTEKDAIIGSIEEVTDELGVAVRVGRGFLSVTKVYEIAQTFGQIEKPIFVFYLGDHDPSGRNIESDLARRIREKGAKFTLERLAIHASDIRKFNLPPLEVKMSDSRSAGFLRRYRNACVELDALPPAELRRRIREAITAKMDMRIWRQAIGIQEIERRSIIEGTANWPGITASI